MYQIGDISVSELMWGHFKIQAIYHFAVVGRFLS